MGRNATNPYPNLYTDGYEAVAENLRGRLRKALGAHYCVVKPNGIVHLPQVSGRHTKEPDPGELVGTYTNKTLAQEIEDDLLEHLRGITAKAA